MFKVLKQYLIAQNRITDYLKYALGEIFLVMIGILLAIQVNTWNEARRHLEKERIILNDLHSDFKQNLERFREIKEKQFTTFNNGAIFFRNIDKLHIPTSRDSVYKYVTGMFGGYTYYPSNGVVKSLISTGDIGYIRNDTLKKYLVSWNDVYSEFAHRVDIDIRFWSNQIEPYIIQNGSFYEFESDKNKTLVEDPKFLSMLVRKQHYNGNVVSSIQNKNGIEFYMKEIVRLTRKK